MNKVGVVILNYNSSNLLWLTLDSLVRAETMVEFTVCVVDNASSSEDCTAAQKYCQEFSRRSGRDCVFMPQKINRGFSGGNNIGISFLFEDLTISHIALLNSDVIASDWWLDRLVAAQKDIISPVTNGAWTMQRVAADIDPVRDLTAFEEVNSFAGHRSAIYGVQLVQAQKIIFYTVMFTRKTIETIGLLDERFFPGNFEDDDYCMRASEKGLEIWVHRGCYIHHWGSACFGKILPKQSKVAFEKNRNRFEKKWNTHWHDSTCDALLSALTDLEYLRNRSCTDERAWRIAIQGIQDMESHYRPKMALLDDYVAGNRPGRELLMALLRKIRQRLS